MKKGIIFLLSAALLLVAVTTTVFAKTSSDIVYGEELYRNDLSEIPDGKAFGQEGVTWSITSEGILQKDGGEGGLVLTDTISYNDNCIISVDFRILSKGVGSDWGAGAGLAIGKDTNGNNGHAITAFDLDAFLMVNSQRLDSWVGYSSHEVTNLPGLNSFHTLSVALNGKRVRVFVDGVYLHEFERLSDEGCSGLWAARWGKVQYKNLTVHKQDPSMNTEEPKKDNTPAGSLRFSQAFGDYMVLQQKKPITVFGFGDAGSEVKVSIVRNDGVLAEGKANVGENGNWRITLPALDASFEEVQLVLTDGTQTVSLEEILIGEVWVAGGQSNMDFALVDCDTSTEIRTEPFPSAIRFYRCDVDGSSTVLNEAFGHWVECDAWSVAQKQSAIGYYFAKNLFEALEVPVGILQVSKEGTGLNQWIGKDTVEDHSDYHVFLKSTGVSMDAAFLYYNSRIAPLYGFQTAGILWYQGEAECSGYRPDILREGLPVLNDCWSHIFGNGDQLPMIVFELASYAYEGTDSKGYLTGGPNGTTIPAGNEALRNAAKELSAKGIAAIIPQYDVNKDTSNLHPLGKKALGDRAADAVLGLVYKKKEIFLSPEVVSASRNGDDIFVTFSNVGEGLKKEGLRLRGFYLLDESLAATEITADIIDNETVVLHTKGIDYAYIGYAFANQNGAANLYNSEGYAALPFRISAERIDERKVDESQTQDAATETVNSDEQSGNDTAETGKKQEENKNVLVSVILGAFGIIALAAAAIGLHNRKKIRLRRNKS